MNFKNQSPDLNLEIEALESKLSLQANESSEIEATKATLSAIKTINNAFLNISLPSFLPPLTCEKIDSGFHYYKDKHSGDLECFEVESENALSRIVFQEKDNVLSIYNLKEKRASRDLDVSYRYRLSLLEAKEKIDEFLNKIKTLVGYKNLEENERVLNIRLEGL